MARTIAEIYEEMVVEKQSKTTLNGLQPNKDDFQTYLNDLTTQSKVGAWRLFFFIISVAIWTHENLFDLFQEEIEDRAAEIISGTPVWYRDQTLIFQNGDSVEWNGTRYQYLVYDETKQIIKRAAVFVVGNQVRIKAAKLNTSGSPEKLTTAEKDALTTYINRIKFAGTNIAVISHDPDLLKIGYDVYYDPLILNSNGELITDETIKPVEYAINSYIQNLPFDGILNLTKLTDQIQSANGVVDPIITFSEAKYGSLVYTPIINNYNANAGHLKIDPAFPLSGQINYMPNV